MKRVVSISLGTSKRDKSAVTTIGGEEIRIERIGTDGDKRRFARLVAELDGRVDCFGVGGTDAYLHAGTRRYAFRETLRLMEGARATPWVDGSGLKHTLERETVRYLDEKGIVPFGNIAVLLVAAVDRFGMAEALAARARSIVFGDLIYGLGIPVPIRSWRTLQVLARIALPLVVRVPIEWLYPTGAKQEQTVPRFPRFFERADVVAGDWHIIRRNMPERLDGKVVLTQSSRAAEVELLKRRGVRMLVTTTPEIAGEAFATNVMEAVLVVLSGRRPDELTPEWYLGRLRDLGWRPSIRRFDDSQPVLNSDPLHS
ncbi:MAG: quinate 5-dehydrogenase [Chthonomonadales bacterium]|nr:quinate 5-dehydrogenase [Chthonomonadales bacterium]